MKQTFNKAAETKETQQYAVVVYYSFANESCVYLFDTYEKACSYLEAMWQYCYNAELAENPERIDEDGTYHEEAYAQIKWGNEDNCIRAWEVTAVSKPLKINGKDWK